MTRIDIAAARLRSQHIGARRLTTPHDVVSTLGAVQAQDYLGALWAVGLRMRTPSEQAVEQALAERSIVRTWPLRGTLHLVAAEDARWMLDLLTPRVVAQQAARQEREHGLDIATVKRSRTAIQRALQDGRQLTRAALYAALEQAKIATGTQRGLQIVWRLAHEGLICFGARQGKQQTFVLLDEWLPASKPKARDEALGELTRRYFSGHGPATIADFVWWSGLTNADAKKGLEIAGAALEQEVVDEQTYWFAPSGRRTKIDPVHLLPPFDEYTVGYMDRSAVLDPAFTRKVNNGGGMIQSVIVANGRVVGTWKRVLRGSSVEITAALFGTLGRKERDALDAAGERYGAFLGANTATVDPALISGRTG
jgi:hypothetical protein